MSANRRDFIKIVVAGAIASGCPVQLPLEAQAADHSPVVDGEDNRICHQVRDGKVFSLPPATGKRDVVIVGGGISGLTAAYLLQGRDFLLLEKEPHWGGNAYLNEYQGQAYATGTAFIGRSEGAYEFAKEIGLTPLPIDNWDGSVIKGEFVPDTWGDGLDKLPYPGAVKDGFKKFKKDMLAIDPEKRHAELFATPFTDFLKGYPAEVKAWWDGYGPSNWGATTEDTAAMMPVYEMHEIAGENRKDERCTWPGGLGALSKKLTETLLPKAADRMQTGTTIVAVAPGKSDVSVTYMQGGELKTVAAKAVIMATPKFITRRLVEGIPDKQNDAMQQIRYIPYAVVNLIYDKPVFNYGYDTWCPGNSFTDVIVADWVVRKQAGYQPKYNILTCYTPLHEEDRPQLLTEPSARRLAERVMKDFQKMLPSTNVDPLEVHIFRRGHPLYMSTPGLFTTSQPAARQPMERVFFANTDSEGPVSTATGAIMAARRAVKEAQQRLG
jgi:protoporphyrinogen oxidase